MSDDNTEWIDELHRRALKAEELVDDLETLAEAAIPFPLLAALAPRVLPGGRHVHGRDRAQVARRPAACTT
jgi:hypothetical protein